MAILGVWKTLVILTAPKALVALATLITLETWKGLCDFFLLFLVFKEILLFNRRPALLYKGGEVKLETLPQTAMQRLITVSVKILSLNLNNLDMFYLLYNLAKGGSIKALWELYTRSVEDNNKFIIYNLVNIFKNNKNLIGCRLIKSILFERIDIIVKQLKEVK